MTLWSLRRFAVTTTVAMLAATLALTVAATATAATNAPTITAPTSDQVVPFRYAGPFTVDMTGAAPGSYTSQVDCRPGEQDTAGGISQILTMPQFAWDGATEPVRSFTSPQPLVTRFGNCVWWIYKTPVAGAGPGTIETVASISFRIAPPQDPAIVAPTAGAVLAPGSTGPFTVDLTEAEPGTYWNLIRCPSAFDDLGNITWDGLTDPVRTFRTAEEIPTLQNCTWTVSKGFDPEWIGDRVTFRVDKAPQRPVEVSDVSQAPATFYPLVSDGYLDTTTTDFWLSQGATVDVTVRNRTGQVVRRVAGRHLSAGANSWRWDGTDNRGDVVPPGMYKVSVHGVDSVGNVASFTTRVTVATKVLVKSVRKFAYGDTGRRGTAGNCTASYADFATELDCWGGRYAQVRYTFKIPASAYNTAVKVSGYMPGADMCCRGRITRTTSRPTKRSLVATVKVTGWRAYTVDGVTATWNYKKRL